MGEDHGGAGPAGGDPVEHGSVVCAEPERRGSREPHATAHGDARRCRPVDRRRRATGAAGRKQQEERGYGSLHSGSVRTSVPQ